MLVFAEHGTPSPSAAMLFCPYSLSPFPAFLVKSNVRNSVNRVPIRFIQVFRPIRYLLLTSHTFYQMVLYRRSARAQMPLKRILALSKKRGTHSL